MCLTHRTHKQSECRECGCGGSPGTGQQCSGSCVGAGGDGDDSATLGDGDGSEGADDLGDMKWFREGCTVGDCGSDHLFSGLRAGCVTQDHDVTMTLIISGTGLSRKLDFQGRE